MNFVKNFFWNSSRSPLKNVSRVSSRNEPMHAVNYPLKALDELLFFQMYLAKKWSLCTMNMLSLRNRCQMFRISVLRDHFNPCRPEPALTNSKCRRSANPWRLWMFIFTVYSNTCLVCKSVQRTSEWPLCPELLRWFPGGVRFWERNYWWNLSWNCFKNRSVIS